METIWDSGIQIILAIQALGTWLVAPMGFFSLLGTEEFYLLIMPVVFWCVDTVMAMRMALGLMVSAQINHIAKLAFHHPRPYWYSDAVRTTVSEGSFGIPSGHAQNAVVVWGMMAASIKKRWAWIAALSIIFLISLSRIYLAVHFPTDVLVGWLIGAVILFAMLKLEAPVVAWMKKFGLGQQIGITFLASLILPIIAVIIVQSLKDWTLPAAWVALAHAAFPDAELQPIELESPFSNAGVMFGMVAGYLVTMHRGGIKLASSFWHYALRYIIGVVGVLVIWRGLGMVLSAIVPEDVLWLALSLRYLRYSLIGLWISYLAPEIFLRARIMQR